MRKPLVPTRCRTDQYDIKGWEKSTCHFQKLQNPWLLHFCPLPLPTHLSPVHCNHEAALVIVYLMKVRIYKMGKLWALKSGLKPNKSLETLKSRPDSGELWDGAEHSRFSECGGVAKAWTLNFSCFLVQVLPEQITFLSSQSVHCSALQWCQGCNSTIIIASNVRRKKKSECTGDRA